jgi:aminoglycoside 3-N-acetyltransferase
VTAAGADRVRLRADLEKIGLRIGSVVLVHASMRRVRPDAGGAATVLSALRDVLGRHGTVVVPAQTTWNSTTSSVFRDATAGMTETQLAAHLAGLPAFDPHTTPSAGMGAFAEHVRTRTGTVRSAHPQTSFAAIGPGAAELMGRHDLDCLLGDRSPLAALYEVGAYALHLGPGFDRATAFHLGEWRSSRRRRRYRCKIADAPAPDGWTSFEDVAYDDGDFSRIGAGFEDCSAAVGRGTVGSADTLLYSVRAAADYAEDWIRAERDQDIRRPSNSAAGIPLA